MCIITFSPGPLDPKIEEQLKDIKKEVDSNRSNFNFKFSWIDSSKHKDWVEKLGIEDPKKIHIRVLRTGRRTKYIEMSDDFSKKNVVMLVERILGGDARSISLRSGVPTFAEDK